MEVRKNELGSSCSTQDNTRCSEFYGDLLKDPVQPLELVLDDVKYLIPAETLLIQKNGLCVLGVAQGTNLIPRDLILLGGGFFKDFVTTVDYERGSFGFGLSK